MPVLIIGTYDADGKPDAMNAAWGGIADDTKINICLSPTHKTVANLKATGSFTVSIATANYVAECDYLGIVSGNDEADKLGKAGLHAVKAPNVNAPMIEESPLNLECKVTQVIPLGSHDLFLAEVVAVHVNEKLFSPKTDAIDLRRANLVAYSHGHYYTLGEIIGKFGFSVEKKRSQS
jgi:flavin reductase (DIM6/NTAB) family NADH-FMN oxidoreductase RutF